MDRQEPISKRVNDALHEGLANGELADGMQGGMVADWAMVLTYYDADGEACAALVTSGCTLTTAHGLLGAGVVATEDDLRDFWAGI